MLNQVVPPRAFLARRGHNLPHGIQLVIAGKDHRFFFNPSLSPLAVINFFLGLLDKHEMAQNIEEAIALEHFFPEVAGAVARGVLWIACAALHLAGMAASV